MTRIFLFVAFMLCTFSPQSSFAEEKESVYDRVMRTGTIRCGYQNYPPYIHKNLVTGEFEGIYPDIFHELADQAGLKIIWAEELGSDVLFESLKTGRVDILCTPLSYTVARAKHASFLMPFIYVPFYVYIRADDHRFEKNPYESLNNENISFIVKDGDLIEILAREHFPKSQRMDNGGLTDTAQMMLSVTGKKADAIVGEPVYAGMFMRSNPGTLKRVAAKPLRVFPATAAVPLGDMKMKEFINTALLSLSDTGFIEKTIARHIENSSDLFPISKPYAVPE